MANDLLNFAQLIKLGQPKDGMEKQTIFGKLALAINYMDSIYSKNSVHELDTLLAAKVECKGIMGTTFTFTEKHKRIPVFTTTISTNDISINANGM